MPWVGSVWLFRGSAAIALLAVASGVLLDAGDFAGNLLAELAGLIASVLVALFVIERIVASDRQRRWAEVAAGTLDTLDSAVTKAAASLYLLLPAPRPPAGDPVVMGNAGELPSALGVLAVALRDATNPRRPPDDPYAVFEAVQRQMALIRGVVLPRLLLIGGEPHLISPLVDLEQAVEALDYDLWLKDRFGLPESAFMADMAKLTDRLAAVAAASQLARAS